jgi:hypothetical protein
MKKHLGQGLSVLLASTILPVLPVLTQAAQPRQFDQQERCYSFTVFDPKDSAANLRRSPNGAIIMSVANGAQVTTKNMALLQTGWTQVQLGRQQGYIFSKFLHYSVAQVIDPSDRIVNLRRRPNGPVLRALPNRTEVMFLGLEGDWTQVRLREGTIGYVFSKFLRQPMCGT